jgi:GGDEF domain-containing protein
MEYYVVLAIIGIWFIYGILIKLTKKRKYDYSMIVAFVFLLGIGYFYFFDDFESFNYIVYSYSTIAVFAFWVIIDNTLLLFKKNVSEFDFYDLEQELEHVSGSFELLRRRFISTIELLNDGISFRDDDNMFGTNRYIEIMGIKDNDFTYQGFQSIMFRDDLVQYKIKLEKLTKKYPVYTIKYRIEKEDETIWVIETGKMIFINKKRSYITTIKTMDIKLFPETDVDVLNTLKGFKKMYQEMQKLSRQKQSYHLVIIQLTNVPKINEKYGRDFGDLMMGEYLSKLRYKFIKDNKSLFRISGIKFGLIVKDKGKFDLLDRALVGTGELLTLKMQFGGVSQTIFPNLGISESPYEGKTPDIVYGEADEALHLSLKDAFEKSYCFYDRK